MKLFIFIFLLFSLSLSLNAEILKPNPSYEPKEVISIQLLALKNNDIPITPEIFHRLTMKLLLIENDSQN